MITCLVLRRFHPLPDRFTTTIHIWYVPQEDELRSIRKIVGISRSSYQVQVFIWEFFIGFFAQIWSIWKFSHYIFHFSCFFFLSNGQILNSFKYFCIIHRFFNLRMIVGCFLRFNTVNLKRCCWLVVGWCRWCILTRWHTLVDCIETFSFSEWRDFMIWRKAM